MIDFVWVKKIHKYILGLFILLGFYFISLAFVRLLNITMPPAILGLVLFAWALVSGFVKESWIEDICKFLINNMAMFLVPFIGGLVVYKSLLMKNGVLILFVIFFTTTLTIVVTGLFVEYGLKILKLYKMEKHND